MGGSETEREAANVQCEEFSHRRPFDHLQSPSRSSIRNSHIQMFTFSGHLAGSDLATVFTPPSFSCLDAYFDIWPWGDGRAALTAMNTLKSPPVPHR